MGSHQPDPRDGVEPGAHRADRRPAAQPGPERRDRARSRTLLRRRGAERGRHRRARHRARPGARARRREGHGDLRSRREHRHADAGAHPARLVPDGRARHPLRDGRGRDRVRHPRQVPARIVLRRGDAPHARDTGLGHDHRRSRRAARRVLGDGRRHGPHRRRHRGDDAAATARDLAHAGRHRAGHRRRRLHGPNALRRLALPVLGRVDRLPRVGRPPRPFGAHARQPRNGRGAGAARPADRVGVRAENVAAHPAVDAQRTPQLAEHPRSTSCGSARRRASNATPSSR